MRVMDLPWTAKNEFESIVVINRSWLNPTVSYRTNHRAQRSHVLVSEYDPFATDLCHFSRPRVLFAYQPQFATTRETWCPLTENNWMPVADNALKLRPADSSVPLHIRLENILLREKAFALALNPVWFIDHAGIVTVSIPEAPLSQYPDPIWKMVLLSTDHPPANRRVVLLYDCANVRIRYNASDSGDLKTTVVFVDMKSNSTFTTKENLDEARRLCHIDILTATEDRSSTVTFATSTDTSTSRGFRRLVQRTSTSFFLLLLVVLVLSHDN